MDIKTFNREIMLQFVWINVVNVRLNLRSLGKSWFFNRIYFGKVASSRSNCFQQDSLLQRNKKIGYNGQWLWLVNLEAWENSMNLFRFILLTPYILSNKCIISTIDLQNSPVVLKRRWSVSTFILLNKHGTSAYLKQVIYQGEHYTLA